MARQNPGGRAERERRPITVAAEGTEDDILRLRFEREAGDRHEAFPIKSRAGLVAQTLSN